MRLPIKGFLFPLPQHRAVWLITASYWRHSPGAPEVFLVSPDHSGGPQSPCRAPGLGCAMVPAELPCPGTAWSCVSMSVLCWQPLIAALAGLKETQSRFSARLKQVLWLKYFLCIKKKPQRSLHGAGTERWCGLQELLWVRETLQGIFSLLLCPVATKPLRYCPCCAIHMCDRCCSFPAGTTAAARSCCFHFHLLQRVFSAVTSSCPAAP